MSTLAHLKKWVGTNKPARSNVPACAGFTRTDATEVALSKLGKMLGS